MSVHNELEYFQITYNRGSALYYLKNELGYDLINCWSLSMLDEVEAELFELYFPRLYLLFYPLFGYNMFFPVKIREYKPGCFAP